MANLNINNTSDQNLSMVRGDTLAFGIEIEGNTQDLDSAFFSVKQDIDSDQYLFRKSLGYGITKVGIGDNFIQYRVRVAPEDTENIEDGNYYYDLEIGLNGDIFTVLRGVLTILKAVERKEF